MILQTYILKHWNMSDNDMISQWSILYNISWNSNRHLDIDFKKTLDNVDLFSNQSPRKSEEDDVLEQLDGDDVQEQPEDEDVMFFDHQNTSDEEDTDSEIESET